MATFDDLYFGSQYFLDQEEPRDLLGVASGSNFDVIIYNSTANSVSGTVGLTLEDNTFLVTWPGQSALDDAAALAANPLVIQPFDSVTVNVQFSDPGRKSNQDAVLSYLGSTLGITFERYLTIDEKPQGNVSETLEFKTDVSEAWDGTEQRTRLRANPRILFDYDYLLPASDSTAKGTLLSRMIGLPSYESRVILWHRPNEVTSLGTSPGSPPERTYSIPEADRDPSVQSLRQGQVLSILNANGDVQFATLTRDVSSDASVVYTPIQDLSGDDIGLTGPVFLLSTANCFLQEDPAISVYPSEALMYEASWKGQLRDFPGNELDTSTLYSDLAPDTPSFDSTRPILREGNLVTDSFEISSESGAVIFDRNIGHIDTFHRRDSSTLSFERMFDYSYDLAKVKALQRFLMWAQGRQRSFYVPSGFSNLVPVSHDNAARTLVVQGTDLGGLTPLLDGYAAFEATWPNGGKTQHRITAAEINADGTVTLTYTQSLNIADVTTLTAIELLFHVRLSSDRIRLEYPSSHSVSCKFRVQTVKQ